MALDAVRDNLDGLSDDVKKEYKAGTGTLTGKFVLDVTPKEIGKEKWSLEDVSGLKSGLSAERTAKEEAVTKLKVFEGIDASAAREAMQKVAEMANWTPEQKVREQIDALKSQLTTKHGSELKAAQDKITNLEAQLQGVMITSAATKAIADRKGVVELLLPHVEKQTRLVMVDRVPTVQILDQNKQARISPKPGSTALMSVEEFVEELRGSDTFARCFDSNGASGGGATGTNLGGGSTGRTTTSTNGLKVIKASDKQAMAENQDAIAEGKVMVDMNA